MWLLELRIEYLVLKGKSEDSKRLIRSRKLMKDRKYTIGKLPKGQAMIYKPLMNTYTTKIGGELRCSGRVSSPSANRDKLRAIITPKAMKDIRTEL